MRTMHTDLHFNFLLVRRHAVQHSKSHGQLSVDLAQMFCHALTKLLGLGRVSLTKVFVAVDSVQTIFLNDLHVALQSLQDLRCLIA